MGDAYLWTTGNDPDISIKKRIGSGGYGSVFEVHSGLSHLLTRIQMYRGSSGEVYLPNSLVHRQAFARKIVREIGQVSKSDIENEARVVRLLMEHGGHENIVTILAHGFNAAFDGYFIDMELCDMTLKDYIDYVASLSYRELPLEATPSLAPSVVPFDCPQLLKMRNIWTICAQIAAGLDFMHLRDQTHRDLKPCNGNTI
jgi:serine/threonine protein kinase